MPAVEQVIFGDNQFFGVNHMSEDRARAQAIRFQDLSAIMDVLDTAYAAGIRAFMCTTHDRVAEICDVVRAAPDRYRDLVFYPSMPYAHKYANAVTEHGLLGATRKFVPDSGLMDVAIRSGRSLARRDIEGLTRLLVDGEMKMFSGLATPVIFLQNVVVDLLLGLKLWEAFAYFARHVREQYGAEPGFITMNLPQLAEVLDEVDVRSPVLCASINSLGFRMTGDAAAYDGVIQRTDLMVIAMSIFASGAIDPKAGIEWVCARPNLSGIVFGASSGTNIRRTVALVEAEWGHSRGRAGSETAGAN